LLGSSERLDLVDILSVDSFTAADFKYLLQSFVGGTTPYVLAGCEVSNPGDAIGTESVAINIHDSVVYHPTSSAGPFFYGLEEGHANAAPLIPELRKNATNFVYLTFDTFDTAQDSRAFWDPDQNGGEGSEFSQDVNTETVLKLEVGVSVATFPEGTIPLAKIVLNASVITSIQDCRNMMFRLGTGGVSPDPFSDFNFQSLPDASYQRSEPSTTMSSSASPNAFQGGDKNIFTMKEWMDVVMTKLKELGNTTYWYESASGSGGGGAGSISASTNFLKSKGQWVHDDSVAGSVQFTEDITSVNLIDPRSIIFRASTKTLSDEQVLYADLIDGAEINTAGDPVDWVNGGYFISFASAGRFANLTKGDWIKKKTDTADKWLRVEEFFTGVGGGGSIGTSTNALSILLSGAYQGSTTAAGASAEYTKGVYTSSELTISNRGSSALQSLTGDFFWLAARSDVISDITDITDTTLVIDTITEADGSRARCFDASGHGLEDGYRITIGAGAYAGTHKVEVEDSTVFYIDTAATGDEASVNAFYAIVTMGVRQSDDDNGGGKVYTGIDLESDIHNLDNDQTIEISGTSAYDASYLITVPPSGVTDYAKKIQIPIPSALGNEALTGLATLPRMSVRDEFGITKIVQGQATDIGDGTSDAIKDYIGMTSSMGEADPDYYTSATGTSYNAKDGMSNYNTSSSDNLTVRAAKLTAMMADRVQDRGLMFDGITTITNTAGTDLAATATINLIKPGSDTQTITLTTSSIVANSAVVTTMDRNGSGAMSTTVETLDNTFTLEENKLILFYRLSTTDIYTWDGKLIPAGETHTYGERLKPRLYSDQDRVSKLIAGGTWSWDLGTSTLTWGANAFIQIPGLANSVNQIDAGTDVLADGDVSSVEINRAGAGGSLAVSTTAIASVTMTEHTVVFARRIGNDVLIGESFLLKDGEYLELDGALAEINRHHGQLKLTSGPVTDQVTIAVPDVSLLDGETLSQEIDGSLLNIASDIIMDFNSGAISGGATGTAFTPNASTTGALGANEYLWYGIGLLPDATDSLNRRTALVQVLPAALGNTTQGLAPFPAITSTKKLGFVQILVDGGGTNAVVTDIIRFGAGTGGGGGNSTIKVDLYDPISSTLPTGVSATIDGQSLANDHLVLFTNLAVDNNKIYKASGVGSSIAWEIVRGFEGSSEDPVDGDEVFIKIGDIFADQKPLFNGTDFRINDITKFYDGANGTDYWELSSLKTVTLTDNTVGGIVFDVNVTGSENWTLDYSLTRAAGIKETGQMHLTSDGVTAAVTTSSAFLGSSGVEFSADIDSGNIRLLYSTTSTGTDATLKFISKRWSNAAGGPSGVPNYSGFTGSTVLAAGSVDEIQFHGASGNLDTSSNFKWDSASSAVNLGGFYQHSLIGPVNLLDNQAVAQDILTVDATTYRYMIINYSITRNGEYQVGRLLVTNNGTITTLTDDNTSTIGSLGIDFSAIIATTDIKLQYISSSTGFDAAFKYTLQRWQ
jgi:hypothetical protein